MEHLHREACVGEILQLWTQAGEASRPPNAWIAEYLPVAPADAEHAYPSPVVNAWLLDDHGVEKRDAQQFVRLMTVHLGLHWAWGNGPQDIFSDIGPHSIGLAGFAPIAGTDLIALHFIWGGLWGRESHYRYNSGADALERVKDIWTS